MALAMVGASAVEVKVWFDGALLEQRWLTGDTFLVGGKGFPVEGPEWVLAERGKDGYLVTQGAEQLLISFGQTICVTLGALRFEVTGAFAPERFPLAPRLDWLQLGLTSITAGAFSVFLLLYLVFKPVGHPPRLAVLPEILAKAHIVHEPRRERVAAARVASPLFTVDRDPQAIAAAPTTHAPRRGPGLRPAKGKKGTPSPPSPSATDDARRLILAPVLGDLPVFDPGATRALEELGRPVEGESWGMAPSERQPIGMGGGGTGEGTIGLGNIGTIGYGGGSGTSYGYGTGFGTLSGRRGHDVSCRMGVATTTCGVAGCLDKEIIRRVVRKHLNEVRFCYEKELVQDAALEGRLTTRFTIDPSGAVCAAEVQGTTVAAAEVGDCVVRAIKRWEFPKRPGAGMVTVSYPFLFKPGE